MARLHGSRALIALTMAMVPLAYFGPLSVTGVPIVEGCTPATPTRTGVLLVTAPELDTGPLSVGPDGFFALAVLTRGITTEEVLAALTVGVQNSTGAYMDGSLAVLRSQNAGSEDQVVVGWSSATPLEPDQDFSVSVMANDQGQGFAMRTGGNDADLVVPPLAATPFERITYDVGELISCDLSFNGCGQLTGVGAETRDLYETTLTTGGSLVANAVAWEVSVTEVDGKGILTDAAPWPTILLYGEQSAFSLAFADQRDEYCVNVVVRDLRSGEEVSEEHCTSPVEPVEQLSADKMIYCLTPPNPELTARWCAVSPSAASDPRCQQIGSGSGGPDGSTVPAAPAEPPMIGRDDDSDRGGCSIARPNGKTCAHAALLAALALFLVGRRREIRRF
jgi:hypothetical protein